MDDKQLQIIKWGVENGKTRAETEEALKRYILTGSPADPNKPPITEQKSEQGYLENIKSDANTRIDRVGDILNRPDSSIPEKTVQVFGQGAGLAANAIEKSIEQIPGVKTVLEGVGSGIEWLATSNLSPLKYIGEAIGNTEAVQHAVELYDTDQNFKDSVDAVANIARLGGDVQMAAEAVNLSKNVTNKLFQKAETIKSKLPTPTDGGIGGSFGATAKPITERLTAAKERIATNLTQKKVAEEAISALPSETARIAVRNGVDIIDVSEITKFFDDPLTSQTSKPIYRELANTAKAYSENGQRGTNPIEIVGKPVLERFKALNSELGSVGQKLGEVADKLGEVRTQELQPAVLTRLQKVPGLSGITVSEKGILNFSGTSLASTLSKADQKAIQQAFTEAVKSGAGKQKHLFRQELFEILGGKKSSGVAITETQDKAFQAIRQGLSDVLESKNTSYKELSNQYRQIIQPLSDARKLLRSNKINGVGNEDLLDMKAGILMRRLTGAGSSGPEIEALLRKLDSVGTVKGNSAVSTRNLQEFYNILNKYYDLSPKTGFQGQIKETLGGGGVADRILNALGGTLGETPAVRQAALEKLLNELLVE